MNLEKLVEKLKQKYSDPASCHVRSPFNRLYINGNRDGMSSYQWELNAYVKYRNDNGKCYRVYQLCNNEREINKTLFSMQSWMSFEHQKNGVEKNNLSGVIITPDGIHRIRFS